MDIIAGLTAAGHALTALKEIRAIDHELSTAELKSRLADIYGSLADVKMALSDAQTLIRERDEKISELLKTFEQSKDLVEVDGFKYRKDSLGRPNGKPFCPACETRTGKLYQIAFSGNTNDRTCPNCKFNYGRGTKQISHEA